MSKIVAVKSKGYVVDETVVNFAGGPVYWDDAEPRDYLLWIELTEGRS